VLVLDTEPIHDYEDEDDKYRISNKEFRTSKYGRLSTGRIPYFGIQHSIFCIRYSKILCPKRREEITGSIKPAFRA